jgi:hypothetical protein
LEKVMKMKFGPALLKGMAKGKEDKASTPKRKMPKTAPKQKKYK